ncbi:hypothetical protein BEWA_031220 [Theileria equi strain WA]|uniref:Uncharacterized protein n=1 Tax=Theileria equi strain WA TaxID=1537102 RepID=L0AZD8_THEEQ|nr:hypothetical protein BEWA_031220 [Theileria equi strain WA]AFZ80269.1 hypothetical protein BEWA_031220 [Theileria equi strain WA]|eukprot:XP_004829935.1 hypothetical protein BEWA_031220 [Theileria equi strain WA]
MFSHTSAILLGSLSHRAPLTPFIRRFASKKDIKIATKITDLYTNEEPKPDAKQRSQDIKRKIRYVYYDPTLVQRIAILKARFFATGWMYAVTAILAYLALRSIYWCQDRFLKDRFGI